MFLRKDPSSPCVMGATSPEDARGHNGVSVSIGGKPRLETQEGRVRESPGTAPGSSSGGTVAAGPCITHSNLHAGEEAERRRVPSRVSH